VWNGGLASVERGLGDVPVHAVRLRANRFESRLSRDALAPANAVELLRENLEHPSHRFWPADIR